VAQMLQLNRAAVVVVVEMATPILQLVLALLDKEMMAVLEFTVGGAEVAAVQVKLGFHVLALLPELVALVYNGQLTLYFTRVVVAAVVMNRLAVQEAMEVVALVDSTQQTEQTDHLTQAAVAAVFLMVQQLV